MGIRKPRKNPKTRVFPYFCIAVPALPALRGPLARQKPRKPWGRPKGPDRGVFGFADTRGTAGVFFTLPHCCAGQLRLVLNNGATPRKPRHSLGWKPAGIQGPRHGQPAGAPHPENPPARAARRHSARTLQKTSAPADRPAQAHSFRPHGRPWLSWVNYSRLEPLRFKPSFRPDPSLRPHNADKMPHSASGGPP